MSSKPVLYHLQTSQSLRVLWLFRFLNAECEVVLIPRRASRNYTEILDVHPLGKSPVLVIDNHAYAESRLCMEQIRDRYASGRLDKVGEEKLRDDYFTEFATATMTQGIMYVLLFEIVGEMSPWLIRPLMRILMGAIANKLAADLAKPLDLMEDALSSRQPYFGGETIGLSDFMMSWPMDLALARGYSTLDKYPKIRAWYDRYHKLESYKIAVGETIVYDPRTLGL